MSIHSGVQFKGNDSKGVSKNYGKFGFGVLLLGTAFSYTVICLRRSLLSWFIISMILSIGGLWVLTKQRVNSQQTVKTRRKFRFLSRENWHEELRNLRVKKDLKDPMVNERPGIALCFSRLIDLIFSEFIDVWFTKISTDTLFQDSVRVELKFVLCNLSSRLKALDIAAVLVNKIVPRLTDHYARFTALKQPKYGVYSLEDKLIVAREFAKGGLHKGVTLSVSGFEAKNQEKQSLRDLITDVLPFLLSPRERSNKLVNSLLTELLSCTVLANVFTVLCEGDFFNLMIVKVVGSNLHHRDQVKRLREALVQHTTMVHDETLGVPGTIKDGLSSSISEEVWIKSLGIGDSPKECEYLNSVLIQEVTSSNGGLGECDVSIVKTLPNPKKLLLPATKSLNLDVVLAEPKYASVFREFLRTSQQEGIFDLWKDIESMRAPLETTDTSEVPLLLEFSNAHDILRIYEKYLSRSNLKVSDSVRSNIAKYASNSLAKNAASYQIARQALFELQNNIYSEMKKKQFVEFQNSGRFLDLMASSPTKVSKSRIFSSGFRRGDVEDFKDESNTDFRENFPLSPAVITAVESAFERIMDTSDVENKCSPLETPEQVFISSNLSHKTSQVSLFGDSKSLESSALRSDSMNRLSALFENTYESDLDANSVLSEQGMDNSESPNMLNSGLLFAPPGDLSLVEKIDVLDQWIQNLSQQNEVLLSLLKKAELTNNVAELKILRRSNASLEKEIELKELQKQQYIVQENDNSLYGKSKVRIQSCVFGKDENLPYVMYVIEVQKYSSEDPNVIVAGWIVARRFSQFFKLHEFLKKRYAEVSHVRFPKKNVPYLKFNMTQQIETRKPQLEKYLQDLLALPDVCSSPALRSFLSSENFHIDSSSRSSEKSESAFHRFNQLNKHNSDVSTDTGKRISPLTTSNEILLRNIREMEKELKQFEEGHSNHKVPFVKPISDLLLTVFDMTKTNWLRGRALLVILQQLLGATIERTVTSQIEQNLRQEDKVIAILTSLETMLFPNGKFRQAPQRRTKAEQFSTRKEAFAILRSFMSETCSRIFGPKSTNQACDNILEILQNDYLNEHLILEILDEIIKTVFPELTKIASSGSPVL